PSVLKNPSVEGADLRLARPRRPGARSVLRLRSTDAWPTKAALLGPADSGLAGGTGSAQQLLSVSRCDAGPQLRAHLGPGLLCDGRPPQHRPGGLLQAAADHVLRRPALGAQADRDRLAASGPPLVPGLPPG